MRRRSRSTAALADQLTPFLKNTLRTSSGTSSADTGGAVAVHDLGGALHSGTVRTDQAPWAVTLSAFNDHRNTINAHLGLATSSGLTTSSGLLTLGTPATVTATTNSGVSGTGHTHAVESTSNGNTNHNWLLQSSVNGGLELAFLRSPLISTSSGNMTIAPSGDLIFDPVGNVARMASSVSIQADNYASQTTGWRATYDGQADFRYLFVDEMHAKSFIADLEQALAGGQIICKSVAMVYSTFTAPAAGGSTTLTVRDLPSATGMAVFVNGDIVRLRKFTRSAGSLTIADCWGVVTLDTSYGTSGFDSTTKTQRYTFVRSAAPNAGTMSTSATVAADAIVLDYGTTGNGFHEVNAIDGAYGANSPYSQIVTWTTHPATGQSVRLRIGNLAGLSVADYGVRMGTSIGAAATTTFDFRASTGALTLGPVGSGKPNMHFDGTDLHMRQNTTNVITLAGSGDSYFSGVMTIGASGGIYQGTGTFSSPTTGLKIWRDGSSIGRIAGYNSGTVQWYANTDGKLYAGAGAVWHDANGVNFDVPTTGTPDYIRFLSGGTTMRGSIGLLRSSGPTPGANDGMLFVNTESTKFRFINAPIYAEDGMFISTYITAISGLTVQANGDLALLCENLRIDTTTGYVAGSTTQTGYFTVNINGTNRKVLCGA